MYVNRTDFETERAKLESEMAAIERKFPAERGLGEIYFWARGEERADDVYAGKYGLEGYTPTGESLSRLAREWKSKYESVKMLNLLISQEINPLAMDEYRDALQR